jgi:hypothetical protein
MLAEISLFEGYLYLKLAPMVIIIPKIGPDKAINIGATQLKDPAPKSTTDFTDYTEKT